jgi:N-acyl-D-amino-acid deacylase
MHDLVIAGRVFDPETIAHPGSYAQPSVMPVDIDHVLLGGSVVVENGEFTGARDERVLRA